MRDSVVEQILLHLYDSIDSGFSYKAKKMLWIDDLFSNNSWKKFKKEDIKDGFKNLKRFKFIQQKNQYDGSIIISLSEKGRLRALNMRFRQLNRKKEEWDRKWRMVSFDIPNTHRKGRDAIRYRLHSGGFYELQESMFIYPHDCEREIRDLVALFKLDKYVRFALLDFIDGQDVIIKSFKLN